MATKKNLNVHCANDTDILITKSGDEVTKLFGHVIVQSNGWIEFYLFFPNSNYKFLLEVNINELKN